jgi:hypothetical protein
MTSQMARSADPKCIWASVRNTIKTDAEIPDNNRKVRAMVRICEEAYPSAMPMPVPEIWKIGPAFPGVPRLGPGGPDPVQSCAAAARLVSYWLHIRPLPRPEGQNRGSKRMWPDGVLPRSATADWR